MIDEKLKVGFEQSNRLLDSLLKEIPDNKYMIPTGKIINLVKSITDTRIGIDYKSFSTLTNKNASNYGAMMSVYKENDNKIAEIIINSDKEDEYQRFSLVHELGHLMTDKNNFELVDKRFKLSTHINWNMFTIPKEKYDNSTLLLNEQIANVFALRVLIPFEKLHKKLNECDDLNEIALSFGVTKDAIISRIALGE